MDSLQHYEARTLGQKLGAFVFSLVAYSLFVPLFTFLRLYRKLTGLERSAAMGGFRFIGYLFRVVSSAMWSLHELVRPVIGCGCTNGP